MMAGGYQGPQQMRSVAPGALHSRRGWSARRAGLVLLACSAALGGARAHAPLAHAHRRVGGACAGHCTPGAPPTRPPLAAARRPAVAALASEPSLPRASRVRLLGRMLERTLTKQLPAWILLAAVLAVRLPWLFSWFAGKYYTAGLGAMMLSTALTLHVDDFNEVLRTGKRAVLAATAAHLLVKPPLALGLSRLLGLAPDALVGLVLLAAAPAAQATSVAVLLARGNVALSVVVVTFLNLVAFLTTPLITKLLGGGAAVAVSGAAMSRTTMQVVLAPIVLGVLANSRFPSMRARAARVGPLIGSIIAALFAGSGTALIAPTLSALTPALYAAVGLFHVGGSLLCYGCGKALGLKRRDTRVLALVGARARRGGRPAPTRARPGAYPLIRFQPPTARALLTPPPRRHPRRRRRRYRPPTTTL